MKVTIERSDLPIPTSNPRGRRYRFPFPDLEVGECFIVKGLNCNTLGPYKRYAETHLPDNRLFITRKIDGGVAVWRTT